MKKTSEEELDVLYEEFESAHRAPSRQQTASIADEFSRTFSRPPTVRLGTSSWRPRTRLTTGFGSGFRPQTINRNIPSRCGTARPLTGTVVGENAIGLSRPLTAIRGAGYTGPTMNPKSHSFDPLNMGRSHSFPVQLAPEETLLNKLRKLEARIWELVDESAVANHDKKLKRALELAKDADLKCKVLQKQEEEEGQMEIHDWDLTFCVVFNLALQYEANDFYGDALHHYRILSSAKYSSHGPIVKLNIGNIFVKQRQYAKAIKIYRMALDQLGRTDKSQGLRIKLMQNMGLVLLETKNYADAATNFETIMVEKPGFAAAFHLVVSFFMMNDAYASKTSFQELLQIPLPGEDETCLTLKDSPESLNMFDLLSHDSLSRYRQEQKEFAEKCVLTAARLIAPLVEGTLEAGYDWVIGTIKGSQHESFSAALEISKAVQLIKQGEITTAISILQEFERKESKFHPAAVSNLSFIYYLQGEYALALKYGEMAVAGDCYNEKSFVNLANSLTAVGDLERARALYFEAYHLDSTSIEVLYNLGLVDQRLGHYETAIMSFKKILHVLPAYADVLYQLGLTHELMQKYEVAIEYYLKTLAINQHDSGIFKKLGVNYDHLGEKQQAYSYFLDSYKCNSSDVFVIKWLAMYMIEADLQDQAMDYFENGLRLEPSDPTWLLSMASCQKQLGNTGAAMHFYKEVLRAFPDQVPALEGLVTLSKCMDKQEADWYRKKLDQVTGQFPSRTGTFSWEMAPPTTARALTTTRAGIQQKDPVCPETPRCPKVESRLLWDFSNAGKGDCVSSSSDDEEEQ